MKYILVALAYGRIICKWEYNTPQEAQANFDVMREKYHDVLPLKIQVRQA